MRITHNLAGINAWNNCAANSTVLSKALEKLSSGYRINRAADDAAGLAISEKMRAQITGLNRAVLNVDDGISLVQVAEGALAESHAILNRMSELAVQASNEMYGAEERNSIQREIDDLAKELSRIADATTFNGIHLLDGSASDGTSAQGAGTGVLAQLTGDTVLMVYDFSTTQTVSGSSGLSDPVYDALKDTLKNEVVPNAVQAILNTFSAAFSYLDGSSIGIGLNLYRNAASSTMASVVSGTNLATSKSFQLNVNLAYFDVNPVDGVLDGDLRTELEATIAHEMMHAFMFEGQAAGMFTGDQYPKWYTEGMAQATGGGMDWVKATLGTNPSDAAIKSAFSQIAMGGGAAAYSYGYLATMYLGHLAGGGGAVTAATVANGLDKISAAIIGGDSLDKAIADFTDYAGLADFEVNLKHDANAVAFVHGLIAAAGATGRGALVSGDLAAENLLPDSALSISLFALNPNAGHVINEYPSSVNVWSGGGAYNQGYAPDSGYSGPPVRPYVPGRLGGIILQIGDQATDTLTVDIASARADSLGVSHLSVRDVFHSNLALEKTRMAIERVSTIRGGLGAVQNRLEHTKLVLQNTAENLTQAESRIRDLDMARGMMAFVKQSVLVQAAQAMLAQANQGPRQVLGLLQ